MPFDYSFAGGACSEKGRQFSGIMYTRIRGWTCALIVEVRGMNDRPHSSRADVDLQMCKAQYSPYYYVRPRTRCTPAET